jgi:hypothetical protein
MSAPFYLAKFLGRPLRIWRAIARIFILERVVGMVLEGRLAITGGTHTFGHNAAMGIIGKMRIDSQGIEFQERNGDWGI